MTLRLVAVLVFVLGGCNLHEYVVDRVVYDEASRRLDQDGPQPHVAVAAMRARDGQPVFLVGDYLPASHADAQAVRINKSNRMVGIVGTLSLISGSVLLISGGAAMGAANDAHGPDGFGALPAAVLLGIGGGLALAGFTMVAVFKSRDPVEIGPQAAGFVYLPGR